MRFHFRPMPAFTLFAALMFAALMALGIWQIQRLHWKLGLIASMNRNMHVRAVDLDASGRPVAEAPSDYLHVTLQGRFLHADEVYVFMTDRDGDPVYHVLTPLRTADGRVFLIDRGAVTKARLSPATRRAGEPDGVVRVTGYWRWAQGPGYFTPPPDPSHRILYSRDMTAIERLDGLHFARAGFIEADATPNPGGWPKGGQTVVTLRNEHLQYAITWFALAAGLLGVYLAYHHSRGRLGWRR